MKGATEVARQNFTAIIRMFIGILDKELRLSEWNRVCEEAEMKRI
jgi:hypothetical protein